MNQIVQLVQCNIKTESTEQSFAIKNFCRGTWFKSLRQS